MPRKSTQGGQIAQTDGGFGRGNPYGSFRIAQHYEPEALVGKHVVLVAILKAAKIRGVESRGMVSAASCDGELQVVEVPGMVPGSKVK